MTRTRSRTIHHDVVVNASLERAFRVFTEQFGDFKPREHNLLTVPIAETVFEPRVGGHIYDRGVDGSVCQWARIVAYEPPKRVVFTWDIGPTWQLETDVARCSEVEVRFSAVSAGRTRVELEHRHIERHGDGWESVAAGVDGDAGWPLYMRRFAGLLDDGGAPAVTATIAMARDEREEFAALLEGLTPQQWESPTLCDRWRVHDVVAHAIGYDPLSRLQLAFRFAKGFISLKGANAIGVAEYADRSPQELSALVRRYAEPRGLTSGFDGRIALTDGMIHQQDIRRPLGIPRTIPADRLRTALDFALHAPLIRGAWRARGVRLVATDLDWAHGRGPEVRGTGEALLMAMAGRRAALADLDGPGKAKLAQHI